MTDLTLGIKPGEAPMVIYGGSSGGGKTEALRQAIFGVDFGRTAPILYAKRNRAKRRRRAMR